jgi:hypothetical protein
MNKIKFTLLGILVCVLISPAFSNEGLNPDNSLDEKQISTWYFESDFEKVRDILETYRKSHSSSLTDREKIFIYKYLSVIYAASPDSRDKAESYMYQLLKIKPTIELMDMYISDSIESIFNNVKSKYKSRMEYLERQKEEEKQELSGKSPDSTSSVGQQDAEPKSATRQPPSKPEKNKNWIWWTVGGAAVAGLVTVFLLSSGDDAEPEQGTWQP